ncbi:hypothetical protein [Fimbriimonas ginsengisoli]|uniref:Uncharacterized protein n=1 Tax=Fimbriimonas ginsengisoli Gsoil 348 TaxID=661478 RepID=A0A068NWR6_FIMGI|nr:hypothetical protein [Fimbriimonas ginsengisoli]AIE87812.1 hypothetical protein OP10G_4444 [Fimbriimonas ginsengisoli Gsoil 348]
MYELLFLIGFIGFTAMTALGFLGHGGGRGHGGGHGHGHSPVGHGHGHAIGGSHGHAHAPHAAPAHAHHTPAHLQQPIDSIAQAPPAGNVGPMGPKLGPAQHAPKLSVKGGLKGGRGVSRWLAISPLDLFSFALGAGAAGILLKGLVAAAMLPWFAVLGALVFNFALVKPIIGLMARFAAPPSEGLEGLVAKSGVAAMRFDRDGRGLVCLTLDGASVQVLATLDPDERARGVLVAKGDPVTVIEVDSARNTCLVTRELGA